MYIYNINTADVYSVATYSQSVNVFGAIKTTKLTAILDPIGMVLSLYSKMFARPSPDRTSDSISASSSSSSSSSCATSSHQRSNNNNNNTGEAGKLLEMKSKLNNAEFGMPTAPMIRSLALRGFSDLKLIDMEVRYMVWEQKQKKT
jgi:hypothetical protein